MGNFLDGMEEMTGIPKGRVLEIGLDVLKMMKVDDDIKTTVDLMMEIKKKYSGDELMLAAYAAGIVHGSDGTRRLLKSCGFETNSWDDI